MLMTIAVVVTSCQKEDTGGVKPIPNMKTIECNAGDRPTFTFSVDGNWQISSDAIWCKLLTPAGEVLDMSGVAGTHTITLRITDENIKNEPTEANITMTKGSQRGIIVKVIRGADKLYMRLYDITETPIESIELGYVDYSPFRIEANFRFAATDYPEWVEFYGGSVTGVPGETTEALVRIVNNGDRERFPITVEDGYTITFSDASGNNSFSFPITYDGMDKDAIEITGPTAINYGWEVSLDGSTFRQTDPENGSIINFPDELYFNITALNNDYEVVFFEKVIDCGLPSYERTEQWMHFDKENMALSVDATSEQRYGVAMAFPRGEYNRIRGSIKDYVFEMDTSAGIETEIIRDSYLKYILADFTQCDFEGRGEYEGFYVYHSLTTLEIFCKPYTNQAVKDKWGVEDAYTCSFPIEVEGKHPYLIIDPRIENWTTSSIEAGNASVEFYFKDELLKISDREYELGENKDERMAAHLYGPAETFDEEIYAIFKVGDTPIKMLVVTPPATH